MEQHVSNAIGFNPKKGLGRGMVGTVAKPLAGTFDLLSQAAEGVSNTGTYFNQKKRNRIRYPRHVSPLHNGLLVALYDMRSTLFLKKQKQK